MRSRLSAGRSPAAISTTAAAARPIHLWVAVEAGGPGCRGIGVTS